MLHCAATSSRCDKTAEALCPAVSGLAAELPLLTARGAVPALELQPGDRLITRERGMVPLIDMLVEARCTPMVRIAAGCFGKARPGASLLLPAAQKILLRGAPAWGFDGCERTHMTAGAIADSPCGRTLGIQHSGRSLIRLCQLILPEPLTLYAEGLELLVEEPPTPRLSTQLQGQRGRPALSRAGLRL